jgi:hypothetical protein
MSSSLYGRLLFGGFVCPGLMALLACGGSGDDTVDGGGNDATPFDAAKESAADTGGDANDAGMDTGAQDSPADVQPDVASDAPIDAPPDGPTTFSCGTLECAPVEYCLVSKGLVSLDGGTKTTYSCNALPSGCFPTPTCACEKPVGACTCADNGGDLTYTCSF